MGPVCSGLQCSKIRWITRQPYGWVDKEYTCSREEKLSYKCVVNEVQIIWKKVSFSDKL